MKIDMPEVSAAELIYLLRAEINLARAPSLYVAAQKEYLVEERFDRTAYPSQSNIDFDLVTSIATLTVEPWVESGYWILEIGIECALGPVRHSRQETLTRKELTLEEFEEELYRSEKKRVYVRLYVETRDVKNAFDLWLEEMRARHPESAKCVAIPRYDDVNQSGLSVSPKTQMQSAESQQSASLDAENDVLGIQSTPPGNTKIEERANRDQAKIIRELPPSWNSSVQPSLPSTLSPKTNKVEVPGETRFGESGAGEISAIVASLASGPSLLSKVDVEAQEDEPVRRVAITFVDRVLPKARDRLVTIRDDAPLTQAAERLYEPTCRMVVVCDVQDTMIGVITRTDVIRRIRECQGYACATQCGVVMTEQVIFCRPYDRLDDTWTMMKANGLKSVPVIDIERRPIGLLSARDALEALLESVESEEELLRDYVMCAGYR